LLKNHIIISDYKFKTKIIKYNNLNSNSKATNKKYNYIVTKSNLKNKKKRRRRIKTIIKLIKYKISIDYK